MVDKNYCMSSFLMYRTIIDKEKRFAENCKPNFVEMDFERISVHNSSELLRALKNQIVSATKDGKCALALSGGIDSAILAKLVPKGTMTYTFKCVVPGIEVVDETKKAKRYAEECGLQNQIIEIYWEDFLEFSPRLMRHKGMPIHSIEVQIYKAAKQAKSDGFERLMFGENADIIYGGMDGLLAKDWTIGEFIDRYSYVLPYKVLRNFELIVKPFQKYEKDGLCDANSFINEFFRWEALGSYNNACETAQIKFVGPFSMTEMKEPMDLKRIRKGDTKYLVREIFRELYPRFEIPPKTPMPRAMNEWLRDWKGPRRKEFYPWCIEGMNGDQKWMIMALEWFLDLLDERE